VVAQCWVTLIGGAAAFFRLKIAFGDAGGENDMIERECFSPTIAGELV
jgi:hypothetical protein